MGFFTIFVPDGLTERQYKEALRSGPTYVSTRRVNHHDLLSRAGFERVQEIDLTAEFLETSRAWIAARDRHAQALIAAEGRDAFDERRADSTIQLAAIKAGLLRRSLFICE